LVQIGEKGLDEEAGEVSSSTVEAVGAYLIEDVRSLLPQVIRNSHALI
jgi:hypothetical protein